MLTSSRNPIFVLPSLSSFPSSFSLLFSCSPSPSYSSMNFTLLVKFPFLPSPAIPHIVGCAYIITVFPRRRSILSSTNLGKSVNCLMFGTLQDKRSQVNQRLTQAANSRSSLLPRNQTSRSCSHTRSSYPAAQRPAPAPLHVCKAQVQRDWLSAMAEPT